MKFESEDLKKKLSEMEEIEKDRFAKNEKKIIELEERFKRSKHRVQYPYFIALTEIFLIMSNNLGLQNFYSETMSIFDFDFPKWVWTTVLLSLLVTVSWFIAKWSSKLLNLND